MLRLGLGALAVLALAGFGVFLLLQWLIATLEPSLGNPGASAAVLVPFALIAAWIIWRIARGVAALRLQFANTRARLSGLGGGFAIGGRQYDLGRLVKLYLMWRYRRFFPWWMK